MSGEEFNPRDWTAQPPYLHEGYKSTVLRAPRKKLIPLDQTLSETTGPRFDAGAIGTLGTDLTKSAVKTGAPAFKGSGRPGPAIGCAMAPPETTTRTNPNAIGLTRTLL